MNAYLTPLMGGLIIGLAATGLLYLLGRIAGISGILWGAVAEGLSGDSAWRWLFLVGMVLGPFLYHLFSTTPYPAAPALGLPFAIVGGLLVGFGTRLGSGCTSGHGVCGIGRLSLRSVFATVTFMVFGIATVYLLRHAWGIA